MRRIEIGLKVPIAPWVSRSKIAKESPNGSKKISQRANIAKSSTTQVKLTTESLTNRMLMGSMFQFWKIQSLSTPGTSQMKIEMRKLCIISWWNGLRIRRRIIRSSRIIDNLFKHNLRCLQVTRAKSSKILWIQSKWRWITKWVPQQAREVSRLTKRQQKSPSWEIQRQTP